MKTRRQAQERRARIVIAQLRNDGDDRPVVFCTCGTRQGRRYCPIHAGGKNHA